MATTSNTTLPKEVFAVDVVNHDLLKRAYLSFLANVRSASPRTKTRGLVSGGGKKPWRQKGTGRARVGSSRSPIWRGGGIIFGPTGTENHTIRLSKTSRRVALRQALSLAARDNKILVTDVTTTGRTKEIVSLLNTNSLQGSVLLVVDVKTPELIRATNSLQSVELIRATYLSVFKVLNADTIVMTPDAVTSVVKWLSDEETNA